MPPPAPPPIFRGSVTYSPALTAALTRLDALIDLERTPRTRALLRNLRLSSSPSRALLTALGAPQHRIPTPLHITGSKGKGSVARMVLAAVAPASEARTGWYASPHVERVTERVGVDGREVEEGVFAGALEAALDAREKLDNAAHVTWFDVVTAAAFKVLAESNVTHAAIEVGMGGARDSTNVLAPGGLAVLTNVHPEEHAEIIGPRGVDIAAEKCAIAATPGATLVTAVPRGSPEGKVIEDILGKAGATSRFLELSDNLSLVETNVAIANAVLDELKMRNQLPLGAIEQLSLRDAEQALRGFPGRMESFLNGAVVVDGAHTPSAVRKVWSELGMGPKVVVLALGREKEAGGILDVINSDKANVEQLICTQVSPSGPYLAATELFEVARSKGLPTSDDCIESPIEALDRGLQLARTLSGTTRLIVIGSLHLAGVVRPILRAKEAETGRALANHSGSQ